LYEIENSGTVNRDKTLLKRRKAFFQRYIQEEQKKGRKVSEIIRELSEKYFIHERTVWRDIY